MEIMSGNSLITACRCEQGPKVILSEICYAYWRRFLLMSIKPGLPGEVSHISVEVWVFRWRKSYWKDYWGFNRKSEHNYIGERNGATGLKVLRYWIQPWLPTAVTLGNWQWPLRILHRVFIHISLNILLNSAIISIWFSKYISASVPF